MYIYIYAKCINYVYICTYLMYIYLIYILHYTLISIVLVTRNPAPPACNFLACYYYGEQIKHKTDLYGSL